MTHAFSIRVGLLSALAFAPLFSTAAEDRRTKVELPPMMSEHMLSNMRDHLSAITEIQAALAKQDFKRAADVAENRIGASSLASHGAAHMAPYMPKGMQDIGTAMHQAASRFARTAQEAALDDDLTKPLAGLADITKQCVACHASYRVR